ncbi:hypothetical protein niasHT_024728 [Heterodera trifolii]|uniref:Uncharacterized protein n=1 Tax=Heterodera trifolii TaxID=157864 RepID=A0ABD2K0M2_9BILA
MQKKVVDQYVSKLERPLKHVLSHEFGNGSLCNRCDCPGLDLHFWRKICKNCSCRLDEHDILLPNEQDHGTIVARKLFDRSQQKHFSGSSSVSSLSTNNSSSSSRDSPENLLFTKALNLSQIGTMPSSPINSDQNYSNAIANVEEQHRHAERDAWAWAPNGDWRLARRYLLSLPEEQRPLKGTPGAQLRRQRLAQQLPYHDSDVEHSKMQKRTEHELNLHSELVAHIKQRAIWHPNCFSCSVCQQLLADLLYFYRDGKYFCGRHYAERLYPRCFGCDELIFAREYTFAEEKSWHLEHFCCLGCDRHLSGHQ